MAVIVATLAAAVLLSFLASGDNVLPGDVPIARLIQRFPETPGDDLAAFGNWLGSALGCVLVAAVVAIGLLRTHRAREAAFIALALALHPTNRLLKEIAQSPRPTPDLVHMADVYQGYGFPSGHSMGAALLYGSIFLTVQARTTWGRPRLVIQTVCVLITLLVGLSRIYVGAHWPTDVVGGYLWGTALVAGLALIFSASKKRAAGQL